VVAGPYTPKVPIWVATGSDYGTAVAYCSPDHGFAAGTIWLTQFGSSSSPYDEDYACPVGS
jgi:hypothetical protein